MTSETKMKIELGNYQSSLTSGLQTLQQENIIPRIWEHDHTVWKPDPTEITNRLGWLDIAEKLTQETARMQSTLDDLKDEGYTTVLLLGMGGSSLAPEVFSNTFKDADGLALSILDSTHPGAVRAAAQKLDYAKTLFIVATKSGGTVETLSFFKYFYNQVAKDVGEDQAGEHFVAITDPGSKLDALADRYSFRETYLNDPNIGGRFSVLSFFGLVAAALVGLDVPKLLERAIFMATHCQNATSIEANPGAVLGTIMGKLALEGRDKITFLASPGIEDFPNWAEQLIAESTGKEGKGIFPVVGEALASPDAYGDDRLFVHLRLGDDESYQADLEALQNAGHPVITMQLDDVYDLGGQFFVWEFATAVASYFLEINPFDQPNVESAKVLARQMVATYSETGSLPAGDQVVATPEIISDFLSQSKPGSYLALQAYVHPTPEVEALLQDLRQEAGTRYKMATSLGFGPRFLHSTGQLHKGDAGNGLFIQFTSQPPQDVNIPDEAREPDSAMSFGTLIMSQALGDAQALRDAGRPVISIASGENTEQVLQGILDGFAGSS